MMDLVEEGKETIEEGKEKTEIAADLGLIAAAQKWNTTRCQATALHKVWPGKSVNATSPTLVAHTLGEEESAESGLTKLSKPLMQQVSSTESGPRSKTARARKQKAGG